jgi:hypothetical protein
MAWEREQRLSDSETPNALQAAAAAPRADMSKCRAGKAREGDAPDTNGHTVPALKWTATLAREALLGCPGSDQRIDEGRADCGSRTTGGRYWQTIRLIMHHESSTVRRDGGTARGSSPLEGKPRWHGTVTGLQMPALGKMVEDTWGFELRVDSL